MCGYLQQLFELTRKLNQKITEADIIKIGCRCCGKLEVCPGVGVDEYRARNLVNLTADAPKS